MRSPLSGLARVFDLKRLDNLGAAALALAAAALWGFLRIDGGWQTSAWTGLSTGLAAFLAWAVARELDPDHPGPALLAAALAATLPLSGASFAVLDTFTLLLALRVTNRSTGARTTWIDGVVLLLMAGASSWRGSYVPGAATAVALVLDGLLTAPQRRSLLLVLPAVGLALLRWFDFWPEAVDAITKSRVAPEGSTFVAVVAAGLFGVAVLTGGKPRSVGDVDGRQLSPVRVRAAQLLGVGAAVLLVQEALLIEADAVRYLWSMLPLWAAFGSVGIFAVVRLASGRRR